MVKVFVDMAYDDEDMEDQAVPVSTADKKLMPEYPWGLRITLTEKEMEKLLLDPSCAVVDGMVHLFAMARITSVSCDKRMDGDERHRCELQIEQMAVESEDEENEEAEEDESASGNARRRLRSVY